MPAGSITVQNLRLTYLRGIQLGAAWHGPSADAALEQMLATQLSLAEATMNIQFRPWTVLTAPDPSLRPGIDYDIAGPGLPYVAPESDDTEYVLSLGYHDVQTLTRVRLFEGYDLALAPVFETIPLQTVTWEPWTETVHIPVGVVPGETAGIAWAIDYLVGQGEVPLEVATWVNLGVAIEVLTLAGAGEELSGGAAATRLTMDDITEDIRYGGQEAGGIYGSTIRHLQALRDDIDLVRLRMRYQGSRRGVMIAL